MYSHSELKAIRNVISGNVQLSDGQITRLRSAIIDGRIPRHMVNFAPLFETVQELYTKISQDKKAEKFNIFGFFPATYGMVYDSEREPELRVSNNGTRGPVVMLIADDNKIVVKPTQSSREPGIAKDAEICDTGPEQLETLQGFITEKFLEGTLFSRLGKFAWDKDLMNLLGMKIGEMLAKLHSSEIYYNDTTLTDDFGRSHIIVDEKSMQTKLFDYGVAIKLDRHPEYTHEEIFDYLRTQPGMFAGYGLTDERIDFMVGKYSQMLTKASKGEILSRDIGFIREGLWLADGRFGISIDAPFMAGFDETYKLAGN